MISIPYILASSGTNDEQKEMAARLLDRTGHLSQISGSLQSLLRPFPDATSAAVGEPVSSVRAAMSFVGREGGLTNLKDD